MSAQLTYTQKEQGNLSLHIHDNIESKLHFFITKHNIVLQLQDLQVPKYNTDMNGTVICSLTQPIGYAKFNLSINNDANLTVDAYSDLSVLNYRIYSHNPIKNIKEILNLIPFNKDVQYWANDAITATDLTLKNFKGKVIYNSLQTAYKNISLNAVATHLTYKYNPKLAPIVSQKTELKFQDGILYINPMQAYTYNTYLKDSHLRIDLTPKKEFLNLYLRLDGCVNNDILHLLSTYKIKLPLKQNSGTVDTKLDLGIDLETIDVDVNGTFAVKEANITYLGVDLNVSDALITLHNNDINIPTMRAEYQNIIDANVSMAYNAHTNLGTLYFDINKVFYKGLELYNRDQKLQAVYRLTKEKKYLQIAQSRWKYKNQIIKVNKLTLPFDINKPVIEIPPVLVSLNQQIKSFVYGKIDIKEKSAKLGLDLFQLNYKGISLEQTNTHFDLKYNKNLSINAVNDIYLSLDGSLYKIKKFHAIVDDTSINIKRTTLHIGKYIKTKLYAKYIFNTKKVSIGLNNFILTNPTTREVLYNNKKIRLQAFINDTNITVKSDALNANFYFDKNQWRLDLFSLDRIANNSTLLKKLTLNNGAVSIFKNSNNPETMFQATIHYPYALLMDKNKEIHTYNITGKITKNKSIYAHINKQVDLKITDRINIYPKACGINLKEIIKVVKNIQNSQNNAKKAAVKVHLNATNSYIYLSKNRYVISDKIYMQYADKIITAQLTYKNGKAGFQLKNGKFYLYGRNFNDHFMDNLFAFSKFKGGSLDFSLEGSLEDYKGILFLKKATVLDYKVLNNVLAFVNTVPSLVTFSLPDYNRNGLYVKDGYLRFNAKNDLFNISDFYIEAKELKILGKGSVDIEHNKINLLLNLKTDLASDASKIPLVGYLIFDGKSISTTLKVKGKLNDPVVQTQLAQDIITAPLNIIKRTLTLPYQLVKKAFTPQNDINKTKK